MPAITAVSKKRKVSKTILSCLLALLLILAGGVFLIWGKLKPFLAEKIRKEVSKQSKGLYQVRFSDLDFNLFSGKVYLKNIELIPDTPTYTHFIAVKTAPDQLFRLKIETLQIEHLAILHAIFWKKLQIETIEITKPALTIISNEQPYNDSLRREKPKAIYQSIKKAFKQAQLASIFLKDGSLTFINKTNQAKSGTTINNINITVKEVWIDSLSEKDASRFYGGKSVSVDVSNYRFATADSLYHITVKKCDFNSLKRRVLFENIAYTPRYNKVDFYRKVKLSKDRYAVKFSQISATGIDLKRLAYQHQFYAKSASISSAFINIFNNNAYPEDKSHKPHWDNFPFQQLQKVTTALKIDVLNLKDIDVSYAEADRDSKQTGEISFNKIGGQITNITNVDSAKIKNHYTTAKLHTRLINAADLNAYFKFDLTDKKGALTYSGNLGNLNGALFNKIAVPLAMIKINSVDIQRLNFTAAADNYASAGELKLYYRNLNIELLKKGKDENPLRKRTVLSAIANTFVLENDNPDEKNNFRTGEIKYSRKIEAPFFYYLWQSLLTGIKSSAGLKPEKAATQPTVKASKVSLVGKIGSFLGISKEKQAQRMEKRRQKRLKKQ
jgi:hypothetical protein